jgi:menaquinone-dependent protoporphyrinogen oxidase
MTKALIVYGTRYGAAASTAEEIGKILQQERFEVRVANAKYEKISAIAEFNLIVVGSGIMMDRWTGEPEDFLKRFQRQLASKKVALFVCCGSAADAKDKADGKPSSAERGKRKYLEEKAAKYGLQPIALGFFGGVYNYNKVPWYAKKALEMDRPRIQAAYKETEPGVFDTRDWNAISTWVVELAQKTRV